MSSTQKRGFRVPWAVDTARDEEGDAAVSEATELETAAEADTEAEPEVNEGDARLVALMTPDETTDAAPAASTVPPTAAEADMMETESATYQSEGEIAAEESDAGGAWPSFARAAITQDVPDRRAPARPFMQVHQEPSIPTRDNPLVAGLVKAMREAAVASRAETTSRLQGEATARVEAIRAEATDEAAALRKRVDDDIARIREWSKGEMARIRAETEGRIETRRAEAIYENKEHLDGVERRVEAVQKTVAAFEADMDRFFKQLLAETDPARLATLAASAPQPPDFSGTPASAADEDEARAEDDSTGDAVETEVLEAGAAAEAEAEATEGLDMSRADRWSTAPVVNPGDEGSSEETAAPSTGNCMLFVNGLKSVAHISAFKGAVGQLDGVRSVSVSSGERGMFIFNVGHDPDADLASAIANLSGFAVEITEASRDSLTISAHEAAA